MTARLKVQLGVTLIELILSMVIISIALVGIFSVVNLTVNRSANPVVQQQAVAIAESYLEEILLQNYSGGTTSDRADFDDVSDYNNLPDSKVRNSLGIEITALSQYAVSVSVSDPVSLAGGVNAKQITVTVSGPGVDNLSLVGYKADY